MNGFSTITQKGQVAIPKSIRDYLNLKPFDKLSFSIKDGKVVAQPVLNVNAMLGIIHTKRVVTKKENKELIKHLIAKKYASRS